MCNATKKRTPSCLMLQDEFAHLIDRMNTIQVAVALRHAPREQSVAAEDKALGAGIFFHRPFNHSASSKPGRCQGTQTILRPNSLLNCSSLRLPLALAAKAIAQSGCR